MSAADEGPINIDGRWFIWDEEARQMVQTDERGEPLAPVTERSREHDS